MLCKDGDNFGTIPPEVVKAWASGKSWCAHKLLERFKCEFESENNGRKKNWGTFLSSQHFRGKKGVLELWDGD
jgi:hypothetical protein